MNNERCLQLSREEKKSKVRGTGGNDGGHSHGRVSPLVLRVIGGFGMYLSAERRIGVGIGIRDCKRSM